MPVYVCGHARGVRIHMKCDVLNVKHYGVFHGTQYLQCNVVCCVKCHSCVCDECYLGVCMHACIWSALRVDAMMCLVSAA